METKGTNNQTSPACVKPVKILATASALPMEAFPVGLHSFEGGTYKYRVVQNMRPTHFDEVIVSSVYETLPAYHYPDVPWDSARNFVRSISAPARRARASLAKPVVYSEPVLDLRAMLPNTIAHLMLDIIPFSLLAKDAAGPGLKVLMQKVREPFLSLLAHFGLTPTWEDRRITGEIVKISGTRGLALYDLPTTFDCNGVHFAPEADNLMHAGHATKSLSGPAFERIFLARRAPRSLENQAEIEKITLAYGYKTIFMEDYSANDQLSIAARARHVIALHGSAMGLLLVNGALDSVVEILPAHVYHQLFVTCLGKRVARYEQIMPEYDPQVAHSGWDAITYFKNRNVTMDAGLLESLLSDIHSPKLAHGLAAAGA